MPDPNPLAGMPFAESLANQMNESLQWMSRMWGSPGAVPAGASESVFGRAPLPPGLPSMLMPTFDPQELEKRINDLKTVEHWLDMNRALLHSTIQTLEMQRNAIVALQSMGRSAPGGSSPLGASQASSAAALPPRDDAAAPPIPFDPTPWWNALQQQFARVAAAAAEPKPPASESAAQREVDAGSAALPAEGPGSPPPGKPGRKASGSSG
jgi:hypothetical protein